MQDVYKNIEEYNPERKRKELTVFDDLIPDLISNKKPNQKITELFIMRRKLSFSTVSIIYHFLKYQKILD